MSTNIVKKRKKIYSEEAMGFFFMTLKMCFVGRAVTHGQITDKRERNLLKLFDIGVN